MADEMDHASERSQRLLDDSIARMRASGDLDRQILNNGLPEKRECEECGTIIPQARLMARPSARLCIDCQEALERHH